VYLDLAPVVLDCGADTEAAAKAFLGLPGEDKRGNLGADPLGWQARTAQPADLGLLGRLVLPGKQPIGILVTILVGIVSALIGTWLARQLGISTATSGIDWMELLVQVIVAAVGVALVAGLMGRRRTGMMRR